MLRILSSLGPLLVAIVLLGSCAPAASPTAAPAAPTTAPAKAPSQASPPAATQPAKPAATAATAPTPKAPPKPLEKVTIQLDWLYRGYHAPYALAVQRGYYAEQGLDVQLQEGRGSATVVQLVANKTVIFGSADPINVVQGIARNDMPIKVVATFYRKSSFGVLSMTDAGIKTPKDIEGKSLAATPGAPIDAMIPAFLTSSGVDLNKVQRTSAEPASIYTLMLQGKVDTVGGVVTELPSLEAQSGRKVSFMSLHDYGFEVMAWGLIAHLDTIKEKPDLVRRFVAATAKGFQAAKERPEEAVVALKTYAGESLKEPETVLTSVLKIALELIDSKYSRGKPQGWMAREDWERELDIIQKSFEIPSRPSLDRVYTNEFVPQ